MKPDGGPAFPLTALFDAANPTLSGMSLRDWFAGMALQGIARQPRVGGNKPYKRRAKMSYEYADAMLAEREK